MNRFCAFSIVFFILAASCSSSPKTTRLKDIDLLETTDVMSGSLKSSLFFVECANSKLPIRLSYQKAENQSSDMLRPAEQWMFVERVLDSAMIQTLKDSYDITTIRAAEKINRSTNRDVTHLMTAVVTTVTRDEYKDRTDAYRCQYEIINLQTGELVWSDGYEIKRVASGLSWD